MNLGRIATWALALWPATALAGGFSLPDLGTAALSRSGTFVARADDPTAIWYNPAGVARLRGTHILLNGHILAERIWFRRRIYPAQTADPSLTVMPDRYPHDPSVPIPGISNHDAPAPIPFLAVSSDLRILRPYHLLLMAGLFGPNAAPMRTYPRFCKPGTQPCVPSDDPSDLPGPSRYDTLGTRITVLLPTVGLAWRPIDSLSVGATFQAVYSRFILEKVVMALRTRPNGQPTEDPAMDLNTRIDATDRFTPSGTIGVHWKPASFLELGASAQLPMIQHSEGELRVEIPPGLLNGINVAQEPYPADVSVNLTFPWIVRAGARYIHDDAQGRERFDLELDLVWESTGSMESVVAETEASIRLSDFPSLDPIPLDSLRQEYHWKNTWGVRLGGSLRLYDVLGFTAILRGGTFYESSAMPDEYVRLDFLPLARIGLTLGLGLQWGRWRFDVGYAHLFHFQRTIAPDGGDPRTGQCAASNGAQGCGSKAVSVVPLSPADGTPVGNGTYDMSIEIVTLGLSVAFDAVP